MPDRILENITFLLRISFLLNSRSRTLSFRRAVVHTRASERERKQRVQGARAHASNYSTHQQKIQSPTRNKRKKKRQKKKRTSKRKKITHVHPLTTLTTKHQFSLCIYILWPSPIPRRQKRASTLLLLYNLLDTHTPARLHLSHPVLYESKNHKKRAKSHQLATKGQKSQK